MTKLVQEGGGDGGEALRGGPRSDATAALSLIGIFRIGRLEAITILLVSSRFPGFPWRLRSREARPLAPQTDPI